MSIKELIELTSKAKAISEETGRDFKEVLAEMKSEVKEVKVKKLDFSKAKKMTTKEIEKMEFNRNFVPEGIDDMHAYNRANAIKNLPSSMR